MASTQQIFRSIPHDLIKRRLTNLSTQTVRFQGRYEGGLGNNGTPKHNAIIDFDLETDATSGLICD